MKGRKSCIGLSFTLACVCLCFANVSQGQVYLNTPNAELSGDAGGLVDWKVGGVDYLNRQSAYYRMGGTGPEVLLTGGAWNPALGEWTFNPLPGLVITYQMTLSSATYPPSQLNQTISFVNSSASAIDLNFFLYSDFNLSPGADTVNIVSAAPPRVGYRSAVQTGAAGGVVHTVTGAVLPTRAEAAAAGATLGRLNDAVPTTLNNTPTAGPGDVAWTFQWNLNLAPGGAASISSLYSVPEPSISLLGGLGLLLFGLRGKKHN